MHVFFFKDFSQLLWDYQFIFSQLVSGVPSMWKFLYTFWFNNHFTLLIIYCVSWVTSASTSSSFIQSSKSFSAIFLSILEILDNVLEISLHWWKLNKTNSGLAIKKLTKDRVKCFLSGSIHFMLRLAINFTKSLSGDTEKEVCYSRRKLDDTEYCPKGTIFFVPFKAIK